MAAEAACAVIEAARKFYLDHEHLGWGGHEGIGKALAAYDAALAAHFEREGT